MNQISKQMFQKLFRQNASTARFEIKSAHSNEGAQIKRYFHPHSALDGINYSLAQFTLESRKRSKFTR